MLGLKEVRNKKAGELIRHEGVGRLSDGYIETTWDFTRDNDAFPVVLRDTGIKGLQLRVGRLKCAWQFQSERSDHGKRIYTCKALGYYDHNAHVSGVFNRNCGTSTAMTHARPPRSSQVSS